MVERAKMIAASGDVLPKAYKNNAGACLLILDWAERNEVAIFEGIAEVAFVYGKPVVSAVMQKKLAGRVGWRTKKVDGDERSCTVAVYEPSGEESGRFTYTIELAQKLGLAGKDLWAKDPAQMLYKRATTRALEQYGPGEIATLFVEEGPDEPADSLPAIGSAPAPAPATETVQPTGEPDEPATETTPEPVAGISEEALRASMKAKSLKVATVLKVAQEMHPDSSLGTIGDIAANNDAAMDMADWIGQQ